MQDNAHAVRHSMVRMSDYPVRAKRQMVRPRKVRRFDDIDLVAQSAFTKWKCEAEMKRAAQEAKARRENVLWQCAPVLGSQSGSLMVRILAAILFQVLLVFLLY